MKVGSIHNRADVVSKLDELMPPVPLLLVIAVSWGIAFFEYCLAVPANRWGSSVYQAAQLKTIQEVITLIVFAGFSALYLKEPLGANQFIGFALIAAGAFFVFHGKGA